MAFVIRNKDGEYLYRSYSSSDRRWTNEITQATTWERAGDAKNAAHHAGSKGEILFVQEVLKILLHTKAPEPIKCRK